MKIALALNGNLRTFFMPLRENPNLRVCDFFIKNIIEPNQDCDIFICCGLTDFFMDGKVFYINNTIETINNNGFRVYNNIEFIDKEIAKIMISKKLNETFKNIKSLIFAEDNYQKHPNYLKMKNCGFFGVSTELLINQHNKILILKESIEKSNIKYDYIIRSRFDFILNIKPLSNYNIQKNNVYCNGFEGDRDLIYDWYAFGDSETILKCMDLYNQLDFINPLYVLRCNNCGIKFIKEKNSCIHGITPGDVTLSSETQLARLLKNNNFLATNSHINGFLYRYKSDNTSETLEDVLPKNLKHIKIIDYTATGEVFVTEYK